MASTKQPAKRSRQTRAEARARVLQAAGEVFAERGYERASLDQVAAAAGLIKGAIYSSFSSKEEPFDALMQERIGERLALVEEVVYRHGTLGDTTRDVGAGFADLVRSQTDWHLLFIEFWARAVRDPSLREEFARHRRSVRELVARFLEQQAHAVGSDLPAPADQLAVAVLALSNGIAIEQLVDPDTVDPSIFGTILGLLLDGLGIQPHLPITERVGAGTSPQAAATLSAAWSSRRVPRLAHLRERAGGTTGLLVVVQSAASACPQRSESSG